MFVSSINKQTEDHTARHVAFIGDVRNAYNILIGKLKRKRPLGRTRQRWVDSIKMNLKEIECEGCLLGSTGSQ
jgi:hypothetical protein